ncbi:MAG: GNAT family N-acetyltransferase [Ignavibacteria bacterium]|nr:GNAT family N-acetyltransferase [Ignavibacteria bacterium]
MTQTNFQIRLMELPDAAQLAAYYERNREYHREWSPLAPEEFYTQEFQDAKFLEYLALNAQGIAYKFGIFIGDMLIGIINLNAVERGVFQNGRFGYSIDADYAGKGITTAALRIAIDFAFAALDLHRLEASIMPRNVRSQRVLEKCGFTKFGFSPKYLFINGQWEDHDNYMILRKDRE